jgi:hypothetical protein
VRQKEPKFAELPPEPEIRKYKVQFDDLLLKLPFCKAREVEAIQI